MAYDRNNVFARILRGELPAHRVLEDEYSVAFLDAMPQAEGHTLVVPKAEAENIFDIDAAVLAATITNTQRVARAVRKAFDPPGMVIAQLNGAGAGQTIFHLHFHVLPRYDGVSFEIRPRDKADPGVLAAHAARIRAALA